MEVEQAIESLLAELRRENLTSSTLKLYGYALDVFAKRLHADGVRDVRDIRREHIEGHQAHLLKTNKPRTAAQRVQAVRRLFRHLAEHGQLLIDPSEDVVALKGASRLPRRLVSEQEMSRLLAAPGVTAQNGIRDRAMLELLYCTGMRAGELLALELSDVDLDLGLVHIREGKGRRDRMVPAGTAARKWLNEYLEHARPKLLKHDELEQRLWLSRRGRPFDANALHQVLLRHSRAAGIKSIYPHAIRHACATHMLARGADIRAIQQLLGHKSLATTQRYTKVVPLDIKGTHAKTHPLEAEP